MGNTVPSEPASHPLTLKPPPPTPAGMTLMEKYLHLTALPDLSPNIFTNTYPLWHPPGARGIYGGSVISQSLVAASKTVSDPDLWIHSCHCYFVLGGNASVPIIYHVEEIRTGRSFATREVKAKQKGQPIFIMMVSFQRTVKRRKAGNGNGGDDIYGAPIAHHEISFPEGIPDPLTVPSEQDKVEKMEAGLPNLEKRIMEKKAAGDESYKQDEDLYDQAIAAIPKLRRRISNDPFEWRKISGSLRDHPASQPISQRKIWQWVRSREILPPSNNSNITRQIHLAALGYFSDSWFIGTVTRVNPQSKSRNLGMMLSLDHTIYFHCGEDTKVDGDEWLLVEMDSPWMGEERAVVTQRVWRKSDGKLVATCVQEGMARLKDGRVDTSGETHTDGPTAKATKENKL